jgi:uncharacterized protein
MLAILAVGCAFMGTRLITHAGLKKPWNRIAWTALILLFVFPVTSFFFIRRVDPGVVWPWAAYVSLGFLSLLFTVLVIRDLAWLAGHAMGFAHSRFKRRSAGASSQTFDRSRREFLLQATNAGAIGMAGVLTGYGVYQARKIPGIVRVTVPIANLPGQFAGFKIVQVTDLHAGLTVKRDWIETVANEVHALQPDLIAVTGDLVDGSVGRLRDDVAPLGELQAPHGKFFVTGNHEYYSGAEPWVKKAGHLGYDVLLNEHRVLRRNGESLVLAGVTDYSAGRFSAEHESDAEAALDSAPSETVKLLLAHQPRTVWQAQPLGFDLMLSGHTHGGQFFPWNLAVTLQQPYISGLNKHGGTWVYVSKGTGYWGPPVRLGARSEITIITLAQAG